MQNEHGGKPSSHTSKKRKLKNYLVIYFSPLTYNNCFNSLFWDGQAVCVRFQFCMLRTTFCKYGLNYILTFHLYLHKYCKNHDVVLGILNMCTFEPIFIDLYLVTAG